MYFPLSFVTGLGCGFCIGISILAIKKYFTSTRSIVNKCALAASNEELRVILVVRTDLNMSKGKIAAQCSHAAVGVYEKALKADPKALRKWKHTGQAKVALKANCLEEIEQIYANAKNMGLITSLIHDAGRTQIPANSVTVLGIGPAPKDVMNKVTGHLKLL